MEATEDIQKCMAMAQFLSLEARNLPQIHESGEDPALQQMGALLASNCQKLCIGPSFHFYKDKMEQNLSQKPNKMQEPVAEISDDDEYETVIYKGPDTPYEIVKDGGSKPSVQQNLKLQAMNVRLAETSAEIGGLLSPQFFLQSPGTSSSSTSFSSTSFSSTSRDSPYSSDMFPSSSSSGTSDTKSSEESRCPTTPFTFPDLSPQKAKVDHELSSSDSVVQKPERVEILDQTPCDKVVQKLERVEILDQTPSDIEMELVEWPKKFIENKGFCLGIQPGDFYKEESRPCFYVKLPHRSNYEVLVTNNNQVPCDLDLYINGQITEALRIPAGASRSIDGPRCSKHAFKLFLTQDAPADRKVTVGDRQNGLVKAIFTPCKVGSPRLRSASEPLRGAIPEKDILDILEDPKDIKKRAFTIASKDQDNLERSLDLSRVAEGITLLQGKKKKRNYVVAADMETDLSKQVVLQLRLIASLDEEVAATNEEIYDLEPPPLPAKEKN